MFLPETMKPTIKETIGVFAIWLRRVAMVAFAGSGFLFKYVNTTLGFSVLLFSALVMSILDNRRGYIASAHLMDENHKMRIRLIDLNDQEFVLESLQADRVWYGMPENPQITEQLKEIRARRTTFHENIESALHHFVNSFTDNKKAN